MAKIGHFGVSNLTFQTTQLTFNPVYLAEIFILNTKQTIQTNHIKPQPDVETRRGTSLRTNVFGGNIYIEYKTNNTNQKHINPTPRQRRAAARLYGRAYYPPHKKSPALRL